MNREKEELNTQQLHINLDLQAVFYANEESKQITKKSKGQ